MSCILHVTGEFLDVEALVAASGLSPDRTWKKGDPRAIRGPAADSGATFVVSDAEMDDFAGQLADATAFLKGRAAEVARLVGFPGVQASCLDFGVDIHDGSFTRFCHLPAHFVQLAAAAGLAIEVSYYAFGRDDQPEGVSGTP